MHGDEASNHGYMFGAAVFVNVIEKLVAPRAANIDVDVRAIAALFVQKPLEVEPPAQPTHAIDAQAIRHEKHYPGPAGHGGNPATLGFFHDVQYEQEIGRQAPLPDDLQFT